MDKLSYKDLLLSREWIDFRNKYLIEKNFICQKCQLKSVFENVTVPEIVYLNNDKFTLNGHYFNFSRSPYLKYILWGVSCFDIFYSQNVENFEIKLLGISKLEPVKFNKFRRFGYIKAALGISNEKFKLKWLNQNVENYEKELFEKFVDFENHRILDESGLNNFVNNLRYEILKEINWLYVFDVNVHHNFYQDELLPWEYDLKDLTVLCSNCHTDFHKNNIVKHYDKNGEEKGILTCCWKCGGTGYLPQFDYYMNGICFACNGARYEEFKS